MMEPSVIGCWHKEKELGSGGFGVVSLWINRSTKECLAVKKCKQLHVSQVSQKQGERWKLEVKIMEELDHENIVQFRRLPSLLENELSKYNPINLPILSMEYCSIGNLRNALMKPQNACGFSEAEVLDILSDTSNALQYLHEKNITHRDFKPENIVLQPSASRRNLVIYKIIDLGYAKELDSGTVSFVGTLQYLAPEIFEQQHYSNRVDYWSFGVTAFEVICGIRPFLPTLPPIAGFQYIRNKNVDVISIQFTRTGDIDFSNKLLEENWLSVCLNAKMAKWLGSVLQYDPEKREAMEGSVFDSLKTIISTKTITVFCVYTYEFYSYEVTGTTLFITLLEKISNDVPLNWSDFYIVPTKTIINTVFAMDFYNENNREAMLFIINKHAGFQKNIRASTPSMMKVIMENMKAELNESTLRQLYAQTIYFVLKEEKHFKTLKDSICFISDLTKICFEVKEKLFADIKTLLIRCTAVGEVYVKMENTLFQDIKNKMKDNAELNQQLMIYRNRKIEFVNNIQVQNNDLLLKNTNYSVQYDKIEKLANDLIDHLGSYSFDDLKHKASILLETFYDDPKSQKTALPTTLRIILQTIKIRNKLMNDASLTDFLRYASNFYQELHAFITNLKDFRVKLEKMKEELGTVSFEILGMGIENNCTHTITGKKVEQLLNENEILQIKMEKSLLAASSDINNVIHEVNDQLDSMISDGHSEI